MDDVNSHAIPGTNMPDWSAEESARLAREYAGLESDVSAALAEARELPPSVDNEAVANDYTRTIKRLRDLRNRVEAMRESEKAPWLRRAGAVDSFFYKMIERIARRKETDRLGGADVLMSRLNDYNARRLAEEQRRRDEEARIAREAQEKARREREALEQQRREAEQKAARARNAERIAAAEAEAKRLAEEEAKAREAEQLARDKAADARADASAKPADMARERHGDGAMNTMRQVWHVEIIDEMALDPAALWPFVKSDHKLMALKAWAKVTQHRKPMNGALIEQRSETVVL